MQAAPSVTHRRLARINAFLERQDRIVYTLLVVTAAVGLAWVIWRHQYLLHREQRALPTGAKSLPAVAPPAGTTGR